MSKSDFLKLEKDIEKIISKSERNIISGYRDGLKHLKSEMANLYEKYGELNEQTMYKYKRMEALEKDIQLTVKMLYESNNKEITSTLRKTFVDTSKSIISIVDKDVGEKLKPITKALDVNKVINERMAGLHWQDRTAKYRQDLIYNVQKTVKEGIAQGDTYSTMANRISKTMNVDINKATTIARTETARVKSQSQKDTLDSVRDAGIKMMKTWNSVMDERSRGANYTDTTNHIIMDGITIPYDDDFILSDGAAAFGPKLSGEGKHDINCRCYMTIKFE